MRERGTVCARIGAPVNIVRENRRATVIRSGPRHANNAAAVSDDAVYSRRSWSYRFGWVWIVCHEQSFPARLPRNRSQRRVGIHFSIHARTDATVGIADKNA